MASTPSSPASSASQVAASLLSRIDASKALLREGKHDRATEIPTASPMPGTFVDDRVPLCTDFILQHLATFEQANPISASSPPFFVGLNGIQGCGKSTLVEALQHTLQQKGHETLVISIDDFYLTHADQVMLAERHENNPLVQRRGQLGTHDIPLLTKTFSALISGNETPIPAYDKSHFNGAGDRAPPSTFRSVNSPSTPRVRIVILEGWCIGFQPLMPSALVDTFQAAVQSSFDESSNPHTSTIATNRLADLAFINTELRNYEMLLDIFDVFIQIDAESTRYVYEWRMEAEEKLIKEKGSGMTREEVTAFVDGYYPAYELYLDGVRKGALRKEDGEGKGKQLRLVVGKDRKVLKHEVI